MNKKIKARWVAALRSGKYKQAEGVLRHKTEDGSFAHCCLGVLCDLYAKSKRVPFSRVAKGGDQFPPRAIAKWAGLTGGTARVTIGHLNFLHKHNDAGATFAQIAKAIEEQL